MLGGVIDHDHASSRSNHIAPMPQDAATPSMDVQKLNEAHSIVRIGVNMNRIRKVSRRRVVRNLCGIGCLALVASCSSSEPGSSPTSKQDLGTVQRPNVIVAEEQGVAPELARRLASLESTETSGPRWQALERDIRRALTDDPDSVALLQLATRVKAIADPAAAAEWLLDAISPDDQTSPSDAPTMDSELLQIAVELAAAANRDDLAWRAMRRMLDQSPNDPLMRRGAARLLNRLGYRHEANDILRSLLPTESLVIEELMGMINPLRTYRAFESRPNLEDAEFVKASGPLSVARAMRTRGDTEGALRCLTTYAQPESDPAVAALVGYLLTSSATLDDFRRWLSECPEGVEGFPEYWLAIGTAANRYGPIGLKIGVPESSSADIGMTNSAWPVEAEPFADDTAFVAFLFAWQLEPGCTEAVQGLIASCERLVGGGNARQNQTASGSGQRSGGRLLDQLRDRMIAMDETRWLAIKLIESIGQQQGFDPRMVERLTSQLVSVGRPGEGLSWQEAIVSGMAPGDRMLDEIARRKRSIEPERYRSRRFLGLHRQPSPSTWSVRLAADSGLDDRPNNDPDPSLHPAWTAERSVPVIRNSATELELGFRYENVSRVVNDRGSITKHFRLFEAMGGGIVCLDYDRDGHVDLMLGQGGFVRGENDVMEWPPDNQPADSLMAWRDDRFVDVAIASDLIDSGYTIGLSAADLNADGFDDLLIGNVGPNACWINQGDGTFRRQVEFSDETATVTTVIGAADLTGDALPDVVEVNYVDDASVFRSVQTGPDGKPVSLPGPLHYRSGVHRVYETNASESESFLSSPRSLGVEPGEPLRSTGLGLVIGNFDGRGQNELFIASDQMANQFWSLEMSDSPQVNGVSQTESHAGTGGWLESAAARGLAFGVGGKPLACMGIATGDFDHNGLPDFHVTNYFDEWSNHYLQQSPGQYRDDAGPLNISELSRQVVGFGCQAIDYDHNGTEDIWVLNGHIEDFRDQGKPFRMPAQIYAAEKGRYVEVAGRSTDESTRQWFNTPRLGRALARLDFDRDGDLDAVAGDLTQPYAVLENRSEKRGGSLLIELVGVDCEREAVGACVTVRGDRGVIRRWRVAGDGYACRNEPVLHFGLGSIRLIQRIVVQWPSGIEQTIALEKDVAVIAKDETRRLLILEGHDEPWLR